LPYAKPMSFDLRILPGPLAAEIDAQRAAADAAIRALWARDASQWSADPAVQWAIAQRLGWLTSPAMMVDNLGRLRAFADQVRADGIEQVVLLGMGGSSLAPEVMHRILGVRPGFPAFRMLDSTDPAAVRAAETDPERTLYVVASKSGTTIEPNVLAAYFERRAASRLSNWANRFVAITDPGTPLARRAEAEQFRAVFLNPADIGGRYSAMSYFGLVPAALMGIDLDAVVASARARLAASDPDGEGPGTAAALAALIGAAARHGRDKLTLLLPSRLEPFGLWIEQLIAESTGKHSTGIVPIAGEAPAPPPSYGPDRLFVRLSVAGEPPDDRVEAAARSLAASGAPMVEITWPDPTALGGEFVRWEIATAALGAILQINPFDEPNVQQAKDATRALLDRYAAEGRLPAVCADHALAGGIGLAASRAVREALGDASPEAILSLLAPGDYFALLAYVPPDDASALARRMHALRSIVRDRTRAATMFGYGPRYLHSTGQLHKGGPNTGVFVLVTAAPVEDVPIPGEAFSFGTLELAQALGDFLSLDAAGRRVLHVHLPRPDPALFDRAADALLAHVGPAQSPSSSDSGAGARS